MTHIGVLALQGDFAEHIGIFQRLGIAAREVRHPQELAGLDGLVIPGGESTTVARLISEFALLEPLRERAQNGFPLWGTCAGMIVLAQQTSELAWPTLDALAITVRRNAFGRQVDSFETDLAVPALGQQPFHAVFIRAPIVEEVGDGVEVLARLEDGKAVAVRQANALATAFHPELTEDHRFHRYFIDMVRAHKDGKA
ncbi:MAG: pyridoxal 5'-phosphate synthase glutaminase subunit PdxT [Dehalococcoidia bacterium]|jgi:pyridoxal 5'-phosphate synthase pdxT subunit